MKILFKNAYAGSDILKLKTDGAEIVSVNFYNTLCFGRYLDIPCAMKAALTLSKERNINVLLHSRLDIEGDKFLSTVLLQNGTIAGVSDSITNNMYSGGNALRMYKINGIWAGIAVDKDILYSGVDNLFYGGARIVFHNSLDYFNRDYYGAYLRHEKLCSGIRVGLFKDGAVICDGTIKNIDDFAEITISEENFGIHRNFLRLSKGE